MPRTDVHFLSGGVECAAWLYRPDAPGEDRSPVVVMAHGLGGVKEMRLDAFAERFVALGLVCLVFDYRHFGASGGEPRQLLDIGAQLEDWRAAVAFARGLDGVDSERVVVWGTSFGGGHAIVTAADDPRVAAVIAQCPFTSGWASSRKLSVGQSLRLGALALQDLVATRRGRPAVMVQTYGPPGSTALMTSPDSAAGVRALVPAGQAVRSDVLARFALQIMWHTPGRRTRDLACPALFLVCEHDAVAPPGPTVRFARRARRADVRMQPAGHFDIYVGEAFERNVALQVEFLRRVLAG